MERSVEKGCDHLVSVCADLKPHETALIISDHATKILGDTLTCAAKKIAPSSSHEIIPSADMHGKEPPSDVAKKMKEADVIFGITKMSMAHTQARFEATSLGARYLSLPDYSAELLKRPALYVDFRTISVFANSIANRFTSAKQARIMTSLGTDLLLDIRGRMGNAAPGWCAGKGTLASPPDAEANIAPNEAKTEGLLVVDGSIPCSEIGLLKEPIVLELKNGLAKAVSGKSACVLEEMFNNRHNDAVRVAAEFGIGLNPSAELIGSMLEDEGCLGTIHIGFGSNSTIGGCNRVSFHLDTIVKQATVYIDDTLLMQDGVLIGYEEIAYEC